jgi:hypothetical protein
MLSLSFLSPCTYETHDQRGVARQSPRGAMPVALFTRSFHGINESEDTFPETHGIRIGLPLILDSAMSR